MALDTDVTALEVEVGVRTTTREVGIEGTATRVEGTAVRRRGGAKGTTQVGGTRGERKGPTIIASRIRSHLISACAFLYLKM